MEYNFLKQRTIKHIEQTIFLIENPKEFDDKEMSYTESLEEQIFITLSFIGAVVDRKYKELRKYPQTQAMKFLWNYSKHGAVPFIYVKVEEPNSSSPLLWGDTNFTFESDFYAWEKMPFDKGKSRRNQLKAYQKYFEGQHIPNTLRNYLDIISKV